MFYFSGSWHKIQSINLKGPLKLVPTYLSGLTSISIPCFTESLPVTPPWHTYYHFISHYNLFYLFIIILLPLTLFVLLWFFRSVEYLSRKTSRCPTLSPDQSMQLNQHKNFIILLTFCVVSSLNRHHNNWNWNLSQNMH